MYANIFIFIRDDLDVLDMTSGLEDLLEDLFYNPRIGCPGKAQGE